MSDAWYLAIESSAPEASLALTRGAELVFERSVTAGRRPSEVLMEPLQEALAEIPTGERLEAVVLGRGPGSYNGARVGIAAGQGVALVHACGVAGLCSLEAVELVRSGGPCLAVGDARRETFFAVPLVNGTLAGETELLGENEFRERVEGALDEGRSLFSFEPTGRLNLPDALAEDIAVVTPGARLLMDAWNAKTELVRDQLLGVPPQPFYLREPYVT